MGQSFAGGTAVSFQVANAIVREQEGSYTVTIEATQVGVHTVDVVLGTGSSATDPADYTFTPVTATFATSTTFEVSMPIVDDNVNEVQETIVLSLSNAVGCTPVAPTTFTLTILDNDVPGTALKPGDLYFFGYDNAVFGGTDYVVLTNLVELASGTEFMYFNASYETGGFPAAGVRTDRWYRCDATTYNDPHGVLRVTYTGAAPLPAGSMIALTLLNNAPPAITAFDGTDSVNTFTLSVEGSDGVVVGAASYSITNISTTNPDAVFIGQGDFAYDAAGGYALFEGRLLGGLQEGGLWYDIDDDLSGISGSDLRRSRIPPAIRCFAIQGVATPSAYSAIFDIANLPNPGGPNTQREILAAITDFSNWIQPTVANAYIDWGPGTAVNVSLGSTTCTTDVCGLPIDVLNISTLATAGNWIGDVNQNWFDCLNWDNFQVPDSNTNVVIGAGATQDCEILHTDLYAEEFNQIATSRNLTISAPIGTAVLQIQTDANDRLDVYGDLVIADGAELDMSSNGGADGGTLYLRGDWTNNSTGGNDGFNQGDASQVFFNGSTQQTIFDNNNVENFAELIIDNPAGLQLLSPIEIKTALTFTEGIINTTATEYLGFENNATAIGASDASHVNGPVLKYGNDIFTFPTGKGGVYRPIGMSAPGATSDIFRAEYFFTNPQTIFGIAKDLADNVDFVSAVEYWQFDRLVGTSAVALTMYWNTNSLVVNPAALFGVRFDPVDARWEQIGGPGQGVAGGFTGVMAGGNLTTGAETNFSPVTFGSPDASLPVELLAFEATAHARSIVLDWRTSREVNNAAFVIERSSDRQAFEVIGEVAGGGTTTIPQAYRFSDDSPLAGVNYYRLRQVDFDGATHHSDIVAATLTPAAGLAVLGSYPNPAREQINLEVSLPVSGAWTLYLLDASGRRVRTLQGEAVAGIAVLPVDLRNLSSGLYLYRLVSQGGSASGRFTKEAE
ncbi:MAG: hypothetical protein OHK0039_00900 [Bacteroidia bacterium]